MATPHVEEHRGVVSIMTKIKVDETIFVEFA